LSLVWQRISWSTWLPSEIRWLSRQLRPLLYLHLASFLCITLGSFLALLTPLALRWLIDQIIPQRKIGMLLLAVGLIFLGYQGKMALTGLGNYLMLGAAQKTGLTLRVALLRHLDTLSADYYETTPVGTVMYPFKDPVEEVSYFGSDLLPAILRILLTTSFTGAAMFLLSPALTLAILPLVPVFLITRQHFRKRLGSEADAVQEERLSWSNFLEEHLSSAIPVQLLGQQKRQERKAFRLLARLLRAQQGLFATSAFFTACSSLPVVLAMSAVIGYGGARVLAGTLSVGSLIAFYGFVTQLFEPLSGAADLYARTLKTFASVRRLQSAFRLRPSVANAPQAILLSRDHAPQIEFGSVEFAYPRQHDMLHIPFLLIPPGEHIAVAGENGAGKSTFVKLIARLYDPVCGSIRLGGEDLRNIQLEILRRQVCYSPRDPVLFDGTLASNLRFVQIAATDHDLREAIRDVGLSSFVRSLPDGLGQRIGPGGCQLSGGQRQRLALARALLRQPRVLILDEATSCLDPEAEVFVLENIRRSLAGSTLIVVSHRLTTFSTFGRLLIFSGGRIVGDAGPDASRLSQAAYAELPIANTSPLAGSRGVGVPSSPPTPFPTPSQKSLSALRESTDTRRLTR
jgi:ABC-type multidrug transport system fused ATPase/permease subunit